MENDYSEILKRKTAKNLIYEQAIVEEEAKIIYAKQKMLKDEFRRRLREGEE